ncbi:MAG: carbon-nitrogen hydrolase family protein [Anaerolineae bacterium]|nr:carbon-nitrogen hydrolase family protein [Anaerolineae bacterium]
MREVTVALAQTSPVLQDVEHNLTDMCKIIENVCLQQRVDLIVFPELSTTGYECGVRFSDLAERITEHAVNTLGKRASEYGAHVAFGLAEKQKVESVIYSAAVLIDPEGDVVADYQKVHLKGEQRLAFRPGYRFVTAETAFGVVGLLIGWDLAFAEGARSLALEGAEIIAVCGSWEKPHAHEWRSYAFARAYENSVFIAACNRVGEEPTYSFFGESMLVGPRGRVHARLEEEEPGVAIGTIDLDQARAYQEETQLLQARQPRSYRAVVKMY